MTPMSSAILPGDGNVLTVNGRKLGRIDKGFLINGENKVAGRGNRDFYIRNQNNVVLGELELNGSLVDSANHVIGSLKDNGRILDSNGQRSGHSQTVAVLQPA